MSKYMFMDMGLDVLNGVTGYLQAKQEYELQKFMQEHQNRMAQISLAQNLGSVNSNRRQLQQREQIMDAEIQKKALAQVASAKAAAAAAGVKGSSIDAGIASVRRQAAEERYGLAKEADAVRAGLQQQRKDLTIASIFDRQIDVFQAPTMLGTVAHIGQNLLDTYNMHQPEGFRTYDVNNNLISKEAGLE